MRPISSILCQLCRQKRLSFGDTQRHNNLHSEWDRRLGQCSLTIIVATLVLALTLHIILPGIFAHYVDQKTEVLLATPLLSLAFTSALIMLSAIQLASIARRFAKNGSLYQLAAHGTCGSQAVAVAVAWAQLLDQIGTIGTVCHVLSDHINLLFHDAFCSLRVPMPSIWHQRHHTDADGVVLLDLLAAVLPLCAALVMMCSLRVLITSSMIFLIATLFTSASTTTVALLHNMAKLHVLGRQTDGHQQRHNANNADTLFSLDDLFGTCRWWLLAWPCVELLSFMAEECSAGPRRTIPRLMRAASRIQPALALLALLAFFPFIGQRDDAAAASSAVAPAVPLTFSSAIGAVRVVVAQPASLLPLPALFNSIRLFSARYLMNVGSVCALWSALLCLFLAPTRLLATLAVDQMVLPFGQKHLGTIAKKGGQPRFSVFFVAFCCSLMIIVVPQQWLCRLMPLNIVLRMTLQALLVYVCHFTPAASGHFVADCGAVSAQKYRRVRARAARRGTIQSAEWKVSGEDEADQVEEEDGSDEDDDENSAESEDEAWFRECREREMVLERIWRLASAESDEQQLQQPKSMDTTPLLELNNPPPQQPQIYTYQSIQNGATVAAAGTSPPRLQQTCHLPRQINADQQRHNCFRAPCYSATGTTMTVNGRTVNTVPFPGPHVYETEVPPGWLEAATRRVESGTRAAATRDESAARGAAHRALLLACSAAAVCAAAHAALRYTKHDDYLPLFPLLALFASVVVAVSVIVWLCRLRVDYGSATAQHPQRQPVEGKWLPVGAVFSMFTLVQLFPLFPPIEWALIFGWILIGLFLHALLLVRLDRK